MPTASQPGGNSKQKKKQGLLQSGQEKHGQHAGGASAAHSPAKASLRADSVTTAPSSGTSFGADDSAHAVQPMTLAALLKQMDIAASAHASAPPDDSAAMLRTMQAYIDNVAHSSTDDLAAGAFDADGVDDGAAHASAPLAVSRGSSAASTPANGMISAVGASAPLSAASATPLQDDSALAQSASAPLPGAGVRPDAAGASRAAAAVLNASQRVTRMASALQRRASGQSAAGLQRVLRAAVTASSLPGAAPADSDASAPLDGNADAWVKDLSLIQSMLAGGLPDRDADFVAQLSSDLLDGGPYTPVGAAAVGSSGQHDDAAVAVSASGGATAAVRAAFASPSPRKRSPNRDSGDSEQAHVANGSAFAAQAAQLHHMQAHQSQASPALVAQRIAPFLLRPYALLEDLRSAARTSIASASSANAASPAAANSSAHVTASASISGGAEAAAKQCAVGAQGTEDGAPFGITTPPRNSDGLEGKVSHDASDSAQSATSQLGSSDVSGSTAAKGASAGGEVTADSAAEGAARVATSDVAEQGADAVAKEGEQHDASAPRGNTSAQWHSVVELLINAGPQPVMSDGLFGPDSSLQGSFEHETGSLRSEDVLGGELGAVPAVPAMSKSKRKRAKRQRAQQQQQQAAAGK